MLRKQDISKIEKQEFYHLDPKFDYPDARRTGYVPLWHGSHG